MAVTSQHIKDWLVICEILGGCSGSGGGSALNLRIYDDGSLIASNVAHLNFDDGIDAVLNGGTGHIDISVPGLTGIRIDEGRAWVYDEVRDKWLSTDRLSAISGRKGRCKNAYLRLIEGQASNLTGYRLPRNATITAVSAQTRDDETWTLKIRKNDDPTDLYALAISGASGRHETSVDVDLDEGDRVQFFADTTGFFGIKDPFVWVEIAWRNDNL